MITKIIERNEMIVVGKEVRTTNKDGAFMAVIPNLWKEFKDKNLSEKILIFINVLHYFIISIASPAFTFPPFIIFVNIPSLGITHFPTDFLMAHPE